MDASFIQEVVKLAAPTLLDVDGKKYSNQSLKLIEHDPRPDTLAVSTLTAINDFFEHNLDLVKRDQVLLHVESHKSVAILGPAKEPSLKRTVFLRTTTEEGAFQFGKWMDPETFIINLQVEFSETGDLAKILQVVGNIKDEKVVNHSDDGVSQTVQTKVGVHLGENSPIPNPVKLRPWRTFREIEQPESTFIFRARGGGDGQPPSFALFTAGGGLWKLNAIASIVEWCREQVKDVATIA